MEPVITEEELELDLDELDAEGTMLPKFRVTATGTNPIGEGYIKVLEEFDNDQDAINYAWSVGKDELADRPADMHTFKIEVSEVVEDYDEVGTIFQTEVII